MCVCVRFIGEESVAAGEPCVLTDDPTWIIDPIDGTTNFVHAWVFFWITSSVRDQLRLLWNTRWHHHRLKCPFTQINTFTLCLLPLVLCGFNLKHDVVVLIHTHIRDNFLSWVWRCRIVDTQHLKLRIECRYLRMNLTSTEGAPYNPNPNQRFQTKHKCRERFISI